MHQVDCVVPAKALCGEGLLWDPQIERLWWVDIAAEMLHCFDPAKDLATSVAMPCLISALALHKRGLLIASARGLGIVDPQAGTIAILDDPEPDMQGNRLNDIIAGPHGTLWAGTMSEGAKGSTGALYRYEASGATQIRSGTTISNGLGWSPDGGTLYFIDSVPGTLHAYDGSGWRLIRSFDDTTGKPDGMTVDTDGTLWIAICDRGQVIGMTPEGEITAQIDVPCEIVTNCTFGGVDMKTLYITTGTFSMSAAERASNPLAGGLFAVPMTTPGLPPYTAAWPDET